SVDVLLKERRGVAAEVNAAELATRALKRPTAVIPGTDDEKVPVVVIAFFKFLVHLKWAVKVFGIEPANDMQRRNSHLIHVRKHGTVAKFPITVVVRVFHEGVPG